MEPAAIVVKGARQHNLKNIDVTIPRNKLVVITGLSGSGKSSLAFDTIYAEGQRRYVESLSAYARQFLEQMGKPDVDTIEGLSPAIAIEQKNLSHNPRSTVGTVTEIYDYLRLLLARIGDPFCYQCGKPIESQTISQMVDQILENPQGTKLNILAPLVRGRKGEYHKELARLHGDGFVRVRVDGKIHELGQPIAMDKNKKHDIDLFVDRLVVKAGWQKRLADSLATALNHTEGLVKVAIVDGPEKIFSSRHACIDCGISYPNIDPPLFSFNSPQGACTTCGGLGSRHFFDPALVIPDPDKSLGAGTIAPWHTPHSFYYQSVLASLAAHYGLSLTTPFAKLPQKIQQLLLYGSGNEEITYRIRTREKHYSFTAPFEGILHALERRYRESESNSLRAELESFMNFQACVACHGSRLKPESLSIKIASKNIYEVTQLTVAEAYEFFSGLKLAGRKLKIAEKILKEIQERLSFLNNVGLSYLTLERKAGSLSGGEAQRIRLATQIGSALVGVMYILDEPSIGLHQRDNDRLLATLKRLRDLGNTVLVVEHDAETILAADHVIDLGPGAGTHGGEIVVSGPPSAILKSEKSLTGQYLSHKLAIPTPTSRRHGHGVDLVLKGAAVNNLKSIDVHFPLGTLIGVTGVSGSGKSSLINDTLYPALATKLYHTHHTAGSYQSLIGAEYLDKVIDIDQSPIGRTPRSNPATYTGLFTPLRELYAMLPESQARGYKPGRYSFNVKGGRCEACEGDGLIKIEMHFLPDVYVECEVCKGRRYNRETLEIKYKGLAIADLLSTTVAEACHHLENIPAIRNKLQTLLAVGLGYIELGQSATTLSGGEAQRVKLARELSKRATGRTLYILDEPTTGLHFDDIKKLLKVLHELVDRGNTVIVIEHNLDVIKTVDVLIDLGPEGGAGGGEIVVCGTPEAVARCPQSYTGQYLSREIIKNPAAPRWHVQAGESQGHPVPGHRGDTT